MRTLHGVQTHDEERYRRLSDVGENQAAGREVALRHLYDVGYEVHDREYDCREPDQGGELCVANRRPLRQLGASVALVPVPVLQSSSRGCSYCARSCCSVEADTSRSGQTSVATREAHRGFPGLAPTALVSGSDRETT